MPDFLVTGTDTGVGKTMIAAALLLALREQGVQAIGFKPAETGVDPADLYRAAVPPHDAAEVRVDADKGSRARVTADSDALAEVRLPADSDVLAEASGVHHEAAAPLLRLREPLAPAVAADRAGLTFDFGVAAARVRTLREAGYRVVVEGAGGVLVPLSWGFTVRDLARNLGLHAVVVARAGLGTLNHVCLTVEALRAFAVPVRGVVLNGAIDALPDQTNPDALRRLLPGVTVVVVPHFPEALPLARAQQAMPLLRSLL